VLRALTRGHGLCPESMVSGGDNRPFLLQFQFLAIREVMASSLQWTESWTASHRATDTGLRIYHRPSGYVLIAGRTRARWQDWPVIATCQTVGAAQHAAWSHVSWTPPAIDWRHIWEAEDRPTVTSYGIEFKRGVGYVLKAGPTGQDRQWPVIITGQTLGAAQHAAEGFLSWRPVTRG
jgi:hypothetical protein